MLWDALNNGSVGHKVTGKSDNFLATGLQYQCNRSYKKSHLIRLNILIYRAGTCHNLEYTPIILEAHLKMVKYSVFELGTCDKLEYTDFFTHGLLDIKHVHLTK